MINHGKSLFAWKYLKHQIRVICMFFIDWFLFQENCDEQWEKAMQFLSATAELNYMTQIVIMMFEDPTKVRFKVVSLNPAQARCT